MPSWSAQLISPVDDFTGAPLLRTEFQLDPGHGPVASATLHATARGVFEGFINGQPVSDDVLSPGWSSYEWRLRYRTYNVTALVQAGGQAAGDAQVLGFALGNGWFRGHLTWSGASEFYGSRLGLLAQLEIVYDDGHTQSVVTDDSWAAGPSAVTKNDLYNGQSIDARALTTDWHRPGHRSSSWAGVEIVSDFDADTLTPYIGPPARRVQQLRVQQAWRSPSGKTLLDFGQNLVGWLKLRVTAPAGTVITVRHAEVIGDGELGTRPLRTAANTDTFTCSGDADVFEPTFTFHGFRYAEIDGWPADLVELFAGGSSGASDSDDGDPSAAAATALGVQAGPVSRPVVPAADPDAVGSADPDAAIVAVVVASALPRTGHFECSNELLNQLHRNVVWGTLGNFLDVPTDCPQRDERLGWTGDIAVFSPTAAFLFDVGPFLRDWLADLAVEQRAADGMVGFVIPDVLKYVHFEQTSFPPAESTAVWSDAAVWVPWALWQAYGDEQVLRDQLDSMLAHLRRVESLLSDNGLWDTGFQFGDWLDPTAPPENPILSKADNGVVATACLIRSARLVAEAAAIVGREDDAAYAAALAERTRDAFTAHYVHDGGLIESDAPTVYALAIAFDLLDPQTQARAGERLAALVTEGGFHIQTGFAGTPFIADALTVTGHLDVAYQLLLQTDCPSWLYPVTMGATTVWERWDSMLPDGTINPGQMTSFNHYALGAVADWMHRTIGGLQAAAPGYSAVRVAPRPGGGITQASTSLNTSHGTVSVSWEQVGGQLQLNVDLPGSVSAVVDVAGHPHRRLAGGSHQLTYELEPQPGES